MARPGGAPLRIVAGELGGRALYAPPGQRLRPTAERTREAIFSMLGPLDGESVLDLFCGTGALGLEALSRGAGRLSLVDTEIEPAARNVERLGVSDRCTLVEADALAYLRSGTEAFDIVFCDPPYRLADRLGSELDKLLEARLAVGARVVVESAPQTPLELTLPLHRERRYGAAIVRIHRARGSR
jgi:16S rRNA (guanine966-N2)-methyltransferase